MTVRPLHTFATVLVLAMSVACRDAQDNPDTDPMLLTKELPFAYPPSLYAAGVEGEVGLRLFVDSLGLVVQESTTVVEPSTHPEFDSAAVAGAPYLEFQPARSGGSRIGKTVVLPVKFKHPPGEAGQRDTLSSKR